MSKRSPPESYRYKKGKSGNPKGRPKDSSKYRAPEYLFWKVANEQVAIAVGGNTVKMPRLEALFRLLQTLALSKNASAARLLYKLRRQFPGTAPAGDKHLTVTYDSDVNL
jgi:hypothetical protein